MKVHLSKKKIFILSIVIIIFAALITIFLILRFRTITIVGNDKYTHEEIENLIFENGYDRNVGTFFVKSLLGIKKEIPFVETYDIDIISFSEVKITIYEKSIIGYLDYMGNNMYFDKDGIIVESSVEKIKNVPEIRGLSYEYIILHKQLPVENDKVFARILDISQIIEKYGMEVNAIHISGDLELSLYIGEVKVELGNDDKLSEKMVTLYDLVTDSDSKFMNNKGILNMRVYNEEGEYTLKKN